MNLLLFGIAILIGLMLLVNLINIAQAGSKRPDGRSMAQILGVDPENATFEDIEKLSRKDSMQLFYAANAPDHPKLQGEYQARLLSGGILGGASAFFTHHIFPTGKFTRFTRWDGKAFASDAENKGHGYNIFKEKLPRGPEKILRLRPMRTSIASSKVGKDGKPSFFLDYHWDNKGTVHSMRDEIRQINPELYIGAGYMGLGGGPINPAPFVLIGPPTSWVGSDK